ncbi:MAG: hypothetical protein A2X49_09990 [Lentisphaerae bacterium GWF2_52_8]|nr:MAG: hypothetical protein A2X49_09990 [Lentisphaerae bacterium GWF2_52_8]
MKKWQIACGAAIALLSTQGCWTEHKIETNSKLETTHEVKPIHIIIDINVKVDKALDDFFGDIDNKRAAAPAAPAPAAPPAAAPVPAAGTN